jgi:RecB family endonuclease NucS
LAQEITKDPYNFDFLAMREGFDERELKDALINNVVQFLMELGSGFAFVGREYRLLIGQTEKFCDLLFYNINLHCYVVVEVKIDKFESEYIGQLGTYVTAVNHILKSETENPTIGILICKEKDNVLAQYALESSSQPIGISEYELSKLYPTDFKGTLPSIEEIERQLK